MVVAGAGTGTARGRRHLFLAMGTLLALTATLSNVSAPPVEGGWSTQPHRGASHMSPFRPSAGCWCLGGR
jgi:hypothetical protein